MGCSDVSGLAGGTINWRGAAEERTSMTIPWWFKIAAKIVLSRVPVSYRSFANVGIFRHGKMCEPDYAIEVFSNHFKRSGIASNQKQFVGLELGVGDSVVSAIIANANGASSCYLVDSGRFAAEDIEIYANVVSELQRRGFAVEDLNNTAILDDVLTKYGGIYLTEGLRSLQTIPDSTVDFIWSQAVLEHIRVHEFDAMMAEFKRIVRPGGIMSHRVDLKDHLGGALNNHRISSKTWEADWMAKSGFYTNRISYRDMLQRFEQAGFSVEILHVDRWNEMPTPKHQMADEFSSISDEDLSVSGFDILLKC